MNVVIWWALSHGMCGCVTAKRVIVDNDHGDYSCLCVSYSLQISTGMCLDGVP